MTAYRSLASLAPVTIVAVSLAFLNTLLSFQNVWPTPWVRPTAEISVEIVVLVLLLALAAEFRAPPALRRLAVAIVFVLVIGRYADVTAPALFGRRIDLYWDAPHLPNVVAMFVGVAPAWQTAATALGLVALFLALGWAIARAIAAVSGAFAAPRLRRGVGALAAALLVWYGAAIASPAVSTGRLFSLPVTPVYVRQAMALNRMDTPRPAPPPETRSDLRALGGGDAFVMFLESYGAVVFETPRMRDALAGDYAALDAFIADSGWRVVSAYVESPTFGGGSWLAHSTLLSGRWIDSQAEYRFFLADPRETMVTRFRAAGYRTVALFPGIRFDWPEGGALGFDRILDARTLAYQGPHFGWWTIPDQYSLEALNQREIVRAGRRPLFVLFASIMSHMPFGPTPPYQPDWSRMTGPHPFDEARLAAALALTPEWNDPTAAYLRTVRHNIRLLQGFLQNRAPDGALLVVLGDHQPPAAVSGKDASHAVPVHVFSRNPALIARFRAAGFGPGLRPARPAIARMDGLNRLILKALDSGDSGGAAR